jgi:hypothetical protein
MTQPGPCEICGETNYQLSIGGPSICPSCDCGNFGPDVVRRLGKVILELRTRIDQLEFDAKMRDIELSAVKDAPYR